MDGFDTPIVHQRDDRSTQGDRAHTDGGRPARSNDGNSTHADERKSHSSVAVSKSPIVQLKDVHRAFGHQRVLRGVSVDFPTGKTTVVLGPSGCGKSVMLKHIVGLLRPDQGEVFFEGQRIDQLRESKLGEIRMQIGFLFQMGALFDSMSVRDNVGFPLTEHTRMSGAEVDRRVVRVLKMVGLQDAGAKMPADLSGGQRKRIALARAIVLEPKVILYDEPTTGLDPIRSDVINELIIKLQREMRITSIVVTHDLVSAFKVADFMVMMHEGRILFQGSPQELKASDDPVVQRFLRGEASADELAGIRALRSDDAETAQLKDHERA
jgi:phospholipid/cholesterol/gamma-HCH transport system ATP-binding protein